MTSLHRFLSRVLRRVNLQPSIETCFLSFPKTGNTWLRFLLGRYIQQYCGLERQPLFDESDWLGRCQGYCVGPRMHFSHRPLRWDGQTAADLNIGNVVEPFRDKQVVVLARNPLDVMVSLWMQEQFRAVPPFKGDLVTFIEDDNFGLEKLTRYYRLWLDNQHVPRSFLLLRYEDMRRDTATEVGRLLKFLAIPYRENLLDDAIHHASFDNMKRLEQKGENITYQFGLNIFGPGDKRNPESLHVRKGQINGYAQYLDGEHIQKYQTQISRQLPELGG